jgi:hypothetical protein
MAIATFMDLYEALGLSEYKTGLELLADIKEQGKRTGHLRGIMYVRLSRWEDEGFVESRVRASESVGVDIPQHEYKRVSAGYPRELCSDEMGLEESFAPV